MLKNPIHLFRRDARTFEFPLFKARFFPRTPEVLRKLNYCVAYRHMFMNNVVDVFQDSTLNLMSKDFYKDQYLDFRPEHPILSGYRIAVIVSDTDKLAVINSGSKKIFKEATEEVFATGAKDIDVVYSIKNPVFYASYEYIKEEILNSLIFSRSFHGLTLINVGKEPVIKQNPQETHLHVLKKTYKGKENILVSHASKVKQCLNDKTSLLSV